MRLGFGVGVTDVGYQGGVSDAADGALPEMHTDGMLAEWRFAEGSGTTVADSLNGTYPINLDLPTTPNYTWTSKGISLASGLIQTPSITSARTVAFLYKIGRGEGAGFTISGGPGGSGTGWTGGGLTTEAAEPGARVYVNGLRTIRRRTDTGARADIMNRGGYVLAFRRCASAFTGPFGFGGRHSTTTSRCTSFEIVWAGVWNDTLTDEECTNIALAVRARYAKPRGVYLHRDDCTTQADAALLWGQSNATGRAVLTDLALAERTYASTYTYIEPARSATRATPPDALLVMGTNQQLDAPSTQFGPVYAIAKRRDAAATITLRVSQTSEGGTYLAPSSTGVSTASNTWHPIELASSSIYHNALSDFFDNEQRLLLDGIGPRLKALFWMLGEQDAISATAAPDSATYQGYLQSFYDDVKTYTGESALPMVVGRIRQEDPAMNATAKAAVRAGQADFVAANSSTCTLIDTDTFTLKTDNVHYDGAGAVALGYAFYDAITW